MNIDCKIKSLEELQSICTEIRALGKSIAHCHGVFDVLHIGHVKHFKAAKQMADFLIVSVTEDAFIKKGPNRPVFSSGLRSEFIAALSCVDFVCVNSDESAIQVIDAIKPTFYVKGPEYKDRPVAKGSKLAAEVAAVETSGGQVTFTDEVQFSSSALINENFVSYSEDVSNYLKSIRLNRFEDSLTQILNELESLNVLVIGESLIETFSDNKGELKVFAGGSAQNAIYASGFSNHVTLYCPASSDRLKLKDILPSDISLIDAETGGKFLFCKQGVIQEERSNQLLETYHTKPGTLSKGQEDKIISDLKCLIPQADIVLVSDYSTGFITPKIAEILCRAKFVAIGLNANNFALTSHKVYDYCRSDILFLDLETLRQSVGRSDLDAGLAMSTLIQQSDIQSICIADAAHSFMLINNSNEVFTAPYLSKGGSANSNSAMPGFVVASLLSALKVHPALVSLASSLAIQEHNNHAVKPANLGSSGLKRMIQSLLKSSGSLKN